MHRYLHNQSFSVVSLPSKNTIFIFTIKYKSIEHLRGIEGTGRSGNTKQIKSIKKGEKMSSASLLRATIN
uniref:Uncharacterized protein n=1 Tax=Anguilla anguilla TaxID=7936 RepID=A0A0E9X0L8_ANGAN